MHLTSSRKKTATGRALGLNMPFEENKKTGGRICRAIPVSRQFTTTHLPGQDAEKKTPDSCLPASECVQGWASNRDLRLRNGPLLMLVYASVHLAKNFHEGR